MSHSKEHLSTHMLVTLCVVNKCEPHVVSLVWQPISLLDFEHVAPQQLPFPCTLYLCMISNT